MDRKIKCETRFVKTPERGSKAAIHRVNEVDSLTCPKCSGTMKVISVMEDEKIVKKILKHIGLWDRKERPPPKATGPPKVGEYSIDYSMSQLPCFPDLVVNEAGSDKWLYVDPEYLETFPEKGSSINSTNN